MFALASPPKGSLWQFLPQAVLRGKRSFGLHEVVDKSAKISGEGGDASVAPGSGCSITIREKGYGPFYFGTTSEDPASDNT